jgi:hypothetical protein
MSDQQVLIQIRGDVADINAKLADLKGYIGKVSDETKKMGDVSKNSWALFQVGLQSLIQNVQIAIDKTKRFTDAAMAEESARMKLAVAMRNQGDYSKEALEDLEQYAKIIQETTRFEDDHAISLMGNLKTYGMTNDEIKRATSTILDFALAKRDEGMTTEAASELIGKAYIGNTERLKKYGIIVDENLSRAEKFEVVMKQLNERFGGSAQADLMTYAGRMAQFKNQINDVIEAIGWFILKIKDVLSVTFSVIVLAFWAMIENILKGMGWLSGKLADFAEYIGMTGTASKIRGASESLKQYGDQFGSVKDKTTELIKKNMEFLLSTDNVDKAVSKMKPGKRFIPPPSAEDTKAREEWEKTLRSMLADIEKLDLEPLEQKLIDITKKAEDLREKAAKLSTAAEREKAYAQIGSMPKDQSAEWDKLVKEIGFEEAKKKFQQDWTNWARQTGEGLPKPAWAQAMIETGVSEQAKKDFEDWLKTQQDIEKYTKDQASRLKAIREGEINEQLAELDIAEKLGKAHRDTIEDRIRLEKERLAIQEKALAAIDKEKDPTGWYAQKNAIDSVRKSLADLYRDQAMKNPRDAMKLAMKDLENEWTDTGKQMYNLAKETAQSMQSAFSDFFFDAMDLKLKSLGDYVRSFLTGVQRAIAQSLGQQLTGGLISVGGDIIGSLLGISPGSVYHQGGRVGSAAASYRLVPAAAFADLIPRRHAGGLAPDERLVINRVGERYVTEEQNSWLTGIARAMSRGVNEGEQSIVHNHITINAVDAKSFEELCRRNPQAVVSPVMQSMRDNRTRKEMKSLLK